MKAILLFFLSTVSLITTTQAQNVDLQKVTSEMTALLTNYGKAVEEMDVIKTISYFDTNPQFYVFADGKTYSLEEMKAFVQNNFFKGLKKISINWDKIEVKPLDSSKAVCFVQQTQILTDTRDAVISVSVTATFVGVLTADGWRIRYVHATHKMN